MKELWAEKYRPKTLKEYVFRDQEQRRQVAGWVADGALPHLMFSGAPGTGKTTLAKVLLIELGINKLDILEINASRENSVDVMRTKVAGFAETMPFGDMKYIILDEADYISPNAQAVMRGLLDTYGVACRFLFTCNYPERIMDAIHSRCQGFNIVKLDLNEFSLRIAEICISEGVAIDLDTLDSYVQFAYPDMRKCINLVQQNVVDNVLQSIQEGDNSSSDWMLTAIDLFKSGKVRDARLVIIEKARPEEYNDVFRFMYRNLHLWGKEESQQDQALIVIRDGMVKGLSCADPEINLSATLVELIMIRG